MVAHRRRDADARRRGWRRRRGRDGPADPVRRGARARSVCRHPERRRDDDPAVARQGAAGARGRLGEGVRGDQPRLRRRHRRSRDEGADVPAAARLRRRRAWGIMPYSAAVDRAADRRRVELLLRARRQHPGHLHSLPGGQSAGPRRARRVDGVLGRRLRQLGARRAHELRGRRLDGCGERSPARSRTGATTSPRTGTARTCCGSDARDRHVPGLGDVRLLRRRARAGGAPGRSSDLAPARPRRPEALRRGDRDLRRRRDVPHPGHHARSADPGGRVRRRGRCPSRCATARPNAARCTTPSTTRASSDDVDFMLLGCPHASLDQIAPASRGRSRAAAARPGPSCGS